MVLFLCPTSDQAEGLRSPQHRHPREIKGSKASPWLVVRSNVVLACFFFLFFKGKVVLACFFSVDGAGLLGVHVLCLGLF
jgi:hypothetical protein